MATKVITVPIMNTNDAASCFRQNWLSRNPPSPQAHSDSSSNGSTEPNLDGGLTSLNWLQNLWIMRIQQPTPPSSPSLLGSASQRLNTTITIQTNKNGSSGHPRIKTTQEEAKAISRIGHHHQTTTTTTSIDQIDYKANQYVKPPYSYATLIWMAMKASKKNKITLSAIYKWITENFKYYQTADPSWQNSIRHNLSLNKCFMKVPRRKDEPGKGGFWQIDPTHAELLENGIFKKRRSTSTRDYIPKNIKRIKIEPVDDGYECNEKHHSRKQSALKRKPPNLDQSKFRPLQLNSLGDLSDSDDNLPSAVLKDDFGWNSIFQSEIGVEGIKVKTEDILNESDPDRCLSPCLQISPPPSNEAPQNFEDLLDLSINDMHIPRPTWFDEHLQGLDLISEETKMLLDGIDLPPLPVSSINDQQSHPWAEAGGPVSFDVEDLLGLQSVSGDDMPWDLSLQPVPSL